MKRLLPSPALSIALFILWVLLTQSLSAGTTLLGLGLALFWPRVTSRLGVHARSPRRPLLMVKLLARVVIDMLRANIEVAWLILARDPRRIPSRFVRVPLDLEDSNGLAVLAMIVTFTPGTAWAELSVDKRVLILHVLSAQDDSQTATVIKNRYEQPLREIFE